MKISKRNCKRFVCLFFAFSFLIASIPFFVPSVSASTLETPWRIKIGYSDDGETWGYITRDFGSFMIPGDHPWWSIDALLYDGYMGSPLYITGNIACFGVKIANQDSTDFISFSRSGGNLGTSYFPKPWGGAFYTGIGKFNYNTYASLLEPIQGPDIDSVAYLTSSVYYCSFQLRADNDSPYTFNLSTPVKFHFRFGNGSNWTPVFFCLSCNTFATLSLDDIELGMTAIRQLLNNIWSYVEYWDQFIMKIGDLSTATQTQVSLLTQILAKDGEIKTDTGSILDHTRVIDSNIDEILGIEQEHEQMIQDVMDIGAEDALDSAYDSIEAEDAFGVVEGFSGAMGNLPSYSDQGISGGVNAGLDWFSSSTYQALRPNATRGKDEIEVVDFLSGNLHDILDFLGGD